MESLINECTIFTSTGHIKLNDTCKNTVMIPQTFNLAFSDEDEIMLIESAHYCRGMCDRHNCEDNALASHNCSWSSF